MEYDQVVLFLQGLLDALVERIYVKVKLDVDDPDMFACKGYFREMVEAALAFNRTVADVAKIWALGTGTVSRQPEVAWQANEPAMKILQRPESTPAQNPAP